MQAEKLCRIEPRNPVYEPISFHTKNYYVKKSRILLESGLQTTVLQ